MDRIWVFRLPFVVVWCSHRSFNFFYGQTEYASSDFLVVKLDDHTDYMGIWSSHGQTECESSDFLVLWLDDHTDYKNFWFSHGQIWYVSSDLFAKKL